MYLIINSNKNQTYRPLKNHDPGTKRYELMKYTTATLKTGDLETAVKCPPGEDVNEWIAANSML